MEWWKLVIYAVVAVIMAIFSGIAGGGGGFVMTPLMIFLGLTPAQAVSSGKISGLAITLGALGGMRSIHGRLSKWRIIPVMVLAFVVGLFVPYAIKSLDNEFYRVALGVVLLLMIPVMLVKKIGIEPQKPSTLKKYLGAGLLTLALTLQGIFSGGLGSLVNVVLMGMLGMTANEANVTKRWSQLILNITIIFGVITSGLIVWQIVAVAVPAAFVGGYIGGRIAVKKGNQFVVSTMILLMAISALGLIFGF